MHCYCKDFVKLAGHKAGFVYIIDLNSGLEKLVKENKQFINDQVMLLMEIFLKAHGCEPYYPSLDFIDNMPKIKCGTEYSTPESAAKERLT